ncbi:MAG: hypothetical protein NW201_10995 [Gemmatimonadales bacterium]|nr:hypothetical protein [Gemmatimonadales bacterium]
MASAFPPPPCTALGAQCRALRVTLRVSSLEEQGESADHEATWLLGHTERITFLELWADEEDLYAEAVLHVPCRHLKEAGDGGARCAAHGFTGPAPREPRRRPQPRQLGGDRFTVVEQARMATLTLPHPKRRLPVLANGAAGGENPCATAPCRTSDHTVGAACCRDLQVEVMCTKRERKLEALLRHRQAPYLCKVSRGGDWSVDAEMISACTYLEPGTANCTLHGRVRPDGRSAKPDLCWTWPDDLGKDEVTHTGCVFARTRRKKVNGVLKAPPRQRRGHATGQGHADHAGHPAGRRA